MRERLKLKVGEWHVDPMRKRIARNYVVRRLQPLSMDVLCYLAERPGEVITQDELLDTLWAGRVVSGSAVHRRVADLRRHLDDDSRSPDYIETVHKRGYRLIADVSCAVGESPCRVSSPEPFEMQLARALLSIEPETAEANYHRSVLLSELGRYREALECAREAVRLDPRSGMLNMRLALALLWIGDNESAAEQYRLAAGMGHDALRIGVLSTVRGERWQNLADALLREGRDPDWLASFFRVLAEPTPGSER